MRTAIIILTGIHAVIHLLSFLRSFGFTDQTTLHQQPSKTTGLLWLLSFLLFITALILLLIRSEVWWAGALMAIVISQSLIFKHWPDTKFGTIANIILLIASIIAVANFTFNARINKERIGMFNATAITGGGIIREEAISEMPEAVQRWLRASGTLGKPHLNNVYLLQSLSLKLKPEQQQWNRGTATQYFSIDPPAFHWIINAELPPLLNVAGRDKFEKGKGEMHIKLLSLITVANAKDDPKTDQASLQRYLAEIVWFPPAALSKYIHWEALSEHSAKAYMEVNNTRGECVFYFDEQGDFKKIEALRYKDAKDKEPLEWIITAIRTEERNGIRIPVECEVQWRLRSGPWTWLKLRLDHIYYNIDHIPPDLN